MSESGTEVVNPAATRPMHPDQLTITTATVADLLADQFPGLAIRPVSPVASHGTVNALFRLGSDLVARFPLEPGDPHTKRRRLEQEIDAARRLRMVSPFSTPEPVALGRPGRKGGGLACAGRRHDRHRRVGRAVGVAAPDTADRAGRLDPR